MKRRAHTMLLAGFSVLMATLIVPGSTIAGEELRDLPAFGVLIPATSPAGFEPVDQFTGSLISGTIAAWGVKSDHSFDLKQDESIVLFWRTIDGVFDEAPIGNADALSNVGRNPFASVNAAGDSFLSKARKVDLPHATGLPAVRFEMPDGKPGSDRLVCAEAVIANNIAYELIHLAPDGRSESGKKAFDFIAQNLKFKPATALGETIIVGEHRVSVKDQAGKKVALTFCLPEPFRQIEPGSGLATAYDLGLATVHEGRFYKIEQLNASIEFGIAGRDLPEKFNRRGEKDHPRADQWARDDDRLRIGGPLAASQRKEQNVFYAGRAIDGTQWFWVVLRIPKHIYEEMEGGDNIAKFLEATLGTVEQTRPSSPNTAPAAGER